MTRVLNSRQDEYAIHEQCHRQEVTIQVKSTYGCTGVYALTVVRTVRTVVATNVGCSFPRSFLLYPLCLHLAMIATQLMKASQVGEGSAEWHEQGEMKQAKNVCALPRCVLVLSALCHSTGLGLWSL